MKRMLLPFAILMTIALSTAFMDQDMNVNMGSDNGWMIGKGIEHIGNIDGDLFSISATFYYGEIVDASDTYIKVHYKKSDELQNGWLWGRSDVWKNINITVWVPIADLNDEDFGTKLYEIEDHYTGGGPA